MNNKYKNESGITLVILTIMIIILCIIAGIAVYEGNDLIKDVKVQSLEMNMYTLKAKSKVFAEDVAARTWQKDNTVNEEEKKQIFEDEYKMVKTTIDNEEILNQLNSSIDKSNYSLYEISNDTFDKMGLSDLKPETGSSGSFIVAYDNTDFNIIDIIYTKGVHYKEQVFYTLSSLEKVLGDE